MNRLELMQAGRAMFGPKWKTPTAAFLGVNRRTISRWIAEGSVPEGPAHDLRNAPSLRLIQRAKDWRAAVRNYVDAPDATSPQDIQALADVVDTAEDALIAAVDELESVFPHHVGELVDVHLKESASA